MKSVRKAIALTALAAVAQAQAATQVYTDPASFLAQVGPGYFLNTFTLDSKVPTAATSYSYSGSGYSYNVTYSGGIHVWRNGEVISTNYANSALVVNFTSGTATAIGGDFYRGETNAAGFLPGAVTVSLSDGTSVSWSANSTAEAFRGFVSTSPISYIIMSPISGRLNVVDNLIVGTAMPVPEPGTAVMLLAGLLAGAAVWQRKAALRSTIRPA